MNVDKPYVLDHPHALDDLVIALLLDEDNPRRSQDGADALQATAALALENLALSEAGKAGLVAAVKQVRYGTATNLHGGLEEGVRLLRGQEGDGNDDGDKMDASPGRTIKRVFLFSDGVVNEGVTDPSQVRVGGKRNCEGRHIKHRVVVHECCSGDI